MSIFATWPFVDQKRWLFIFLVSVIFISGCAYQMASERDRLEASGRYEELEKHLRAAETPLQEMKTQQLFPLCISYSKLKRYDDLFSCVDLLEANISRGDRYDIAGPKGFEVKSDITPMPHLFRAAAYLELGSYQQAIEHAGKADQPFPDANSLGYYSEFAIRKEALTILALSYAFSGNRNAAQAHLADLEGLSLGGFAGIAVRAQEKKKALAKVHMALGDYKKALEYLKSGVFGPLSALTDAVVGAGAEGQSLWTYLELPRLFMYNKCLMETSQLEKAQKGYASLLAMPQTPANGEIYWLILYDMGRIEEQEGSRSKAIDYFRQAIDVIEQQRASIHTEANKIGFIGDKQAVYYRLIASLFSDHRYDLAFACVERSKSRALVDLLAEKQDFAVKSGNIQQVQSLLSMADSAEKIAWTQQTAEAKVKSRGLVFRARQQIHEQSPELASLVSVVQKSAEEIQAFIPAGETLVEYYYFNDDIYVFVVDRNKIQSVAIQVEDLPGKIRAFRTALQDPRSKFDLRLPQDLYRNLFAPIEHLLKTRTLIIVPHGALHYLPFNCLHNGDGYLVDRFTIHYLSSASLLEYLQPDVTEDGGPVLAFGNPDLGDSKYNLAYAQKEAAALIQARPHSRLLLHGAATETAFKTLSTGFPYIHFATHGTFNPQKPLQSAILLAKDHKNDGVLTAAELFSIRLDAELVTLSACETGLGKIAGGDEVVGLTRGFLYAGSRSIVASLWRVDDRSTSMLMQRFYKLLAATDKATALRDAQLYVKSNYNPHPYYWGAFQLTGKSK